MALTWNDAEMTALKRIGWWHHAPCGAKSKKKMTVRVNTVISYLANTTYLIHFLQYTQI